MKSLKLILSQKKYFAPVWLFASLNIVTGTWVLYLPMVKEKFALNDSQLGIALFCMVLGVLAFLPVISRLSRRFGVGWCSKIFVVLFAISFVFPLMATDYLWLCISLFITGCLLGATDVSMNALVSEIEKNNHQKFMAAAHGFFSLGGFVSAGVGTWILSMYVNPILHMSIVVGFVVVTNLLWSHQYHHIREEEIKKEPSTQHSFRNFKILLGLSIVTFISMSNEGAVEHWSNIYLLDIVNIQQEQFAGLGFIAFSAMMTLGRFFGDGMSNRFGEMRMIMAGCLLSFIGYGLILNATIYVTVSGFGILGLGLSVIIPELFRLAARTEKISASAAISIVAAAGYTGFLIGPVVIGLISNASTLRMSYLFLLALMVMAFLLLFFKIKKQYSNHSM